MLRGEVVVIVRRVFLIFDEDLEAILTVGAEHGDDRPLNKCNVMLELETAAHYQQSCLLHSTVPHGIQHWAGVVSLCFPNNKDL